MKRRTKKRAMAVLAAGGVLAGLGFLAGPDEAGAQELNPAVGEPVSYRVGDVLVHSTRTRNSSCSVTRVFRNVGDEPALVDARMGWDDMTVQGHTGPVYPRVEDSAYTEPVTLPAGGQVTAVWTNTGFISEGPLRLLLAGGHVELIPVCRVQPPPSVVTSPPSVDVSVPSVSSSVVEQAPGPEPTTPPSVVVDAGPGPSTPDVGVLTSTLPATGTYAVPVTLAGVGLVLTGWGLLLRAGRLKRAAHRRVVDGLTAGTEVGR